jgi:Double zinc ribbon
MDLATVRSANGPFAGVHDFFRSGTWHLIENLTILLLVAFWLATVLWVLRDARRRIDDPWLVALAVLLGVVPVVGPALYLLMRPIEPLAEVRGRDLEMRVLKHWVMRGEHCPECGAESDQSFRYCPVCATELRRPCTSCQAPLEPLWQLCPFCGSRAEPDRAATLAAVAPLPELLGALGPATAAAHGSDLTPD